MLEAALTRSEIEDSDLADIRIGCLVVRSVLLMPRYSKACVVRLSAPVATRRSIAAQVNIFETLATRHSVSGWVIG